MPETVRTRCIAALTLTLAIVHTAPLAGEEPLSRPQYATRIRQLADALRETKADTIPEILRNVPAVWRVESGDSSVEVPAVWIREELLGAMRAPETWPSVRNGMLQRLQRVAEEAIDTPSQGSAGHSRAARAVLADVLARPEFAGMARESAMSRLRARVTEMLSRWWRRLGGDRLDTRRVSVVFAWLAVLTAGVVLLVWLGRVLRGRKAGATAAGAAPRGTTSARRWAQQALAASDLREAIRCAYRAAVSRLEEDGTWHVDDARTPREYLRMLPGSHARRVVVADVVRRFEEVWFAGQQPDEGDRHRLHRHLEELGCLPAG